jgi:hypothetical protein
MAQQPWPDMKIDMAEFLRNNAQVPLEYQSQFQGQHIAWHRDGPHVVAAAQCEEDLLKLLKERDIPLDEVLLSYVDGYDGIL